MGPERHGDGGDLLPGAAGLRLQGRHLQGYVVFAKFGIVSTYAHLRIDVSYLHHTTGGKVLVVGAVGTIVAGEVHILRLSNTGKPQGAQQAKQYTYTLVTRLVSPVAGDLEFGRVVSTTADGKAVAVSSPNAFINGAASGRVWVYSSSKAQNAFVQTAAFTGPIGTNFGIWQQIAPNGKTLAICDSFANAQKGAINIATLQQKTFALTQTNYLPTVNGYTFSFFCTGLAYSPDSKYIAVVCFCVCL